MTKRKSLRNGLAGNFLRHEVLSTLSGERRKSVSTLDEQGPTAVDRHPILKSSGFGVNRANNTDFLRDVLKLRSCEGSHHVVSDGLLQVLRNFDYNSAVSSTFGYWSFYFGFQLHLLNTRFCYLMLLHRSGVPNMQTTEKSKATSLIMFLPFRSLTAIS